MTDVKIKDPDNGPMPWHKHLWSIKNTIIIIATPIVLLPIIIICPTKPARCIYTIIIMAVYWMTEALPMAVTALLPIVLFPWLGVLGSKSVCTNYLKDANMLFLGGILVAIAVEKWNLHKRVALGVLLLVGSDPLWITFGFIVVTAFVSLWQSSTASTAMMMPIANAVLAELDANRKRQFELKEVAVNAGQKDSGSEIVPLTDKEAEAKDKASSVEDGVANGSLSPDKIELSTEMEPLKEKSSEERVRSDEAFMNFRKALKLSIPYSAGIGGTGTIIGCGPNIVFKGQLDSMYKDAETGVNFMSWLVIGFPTMLIELLGSWILLMVLFFGVKETFRRRKKGESVDSANQIVRAEYDKLGTITLAEVVVLVNFIVLAFLWLSREPGFVTGWDDLTIRKGFVTDACLAITISLLLFVFPSQFPNYLCFRKASDERSPGPSKPILDWTTVNQQTPWSVIILLGGGFALADACKESGLSASIGQSLSSFGSLPPAVVVTLMCIVATVITTFTSNMATTTIFIPIMAELSATMCVNPLYLLLPVTFAASWSFILPVSTPPNAIAHSYGDITIPDMIKAGLVMCVLCNIILLISINTWAYTFFDLGTFPEWAARGNNCTVTGARSLTINESLWSSRKDIFTSTVLSI